LEKASALLALMIVETST